MAAASPAVLEQISKFDRQSKAQFMANYEVRQQTAIMAKLNQILEVIPSDGPEEKFPFFGAVGQIQEFDGASLPMMALGATEHTIENKKWGLGMAVKKDFFNDIGRMPGARERLRNRIANGLAARAVNYLSLLISKLLKGEAPFNTLVSHDGKSLFSADHAGG
ncbi:MAG: Mu-like prophage major head subunit gpT family protein, partial [Vicinamibacterales bacterium]